FSRMSVRDGRVVLPDGVAYDLLALPQRETMTPQVLAKVKDLATSGATVLGPKPVRSPSFQDYPRCDAEVKRLADALWSTGKVITGKTIEQALRAKNVVPDFQAPDSLNYVHRRTAEGEIYFVANQSERSVAAECSFRVTGRHPDLCDPVTGEIYAAHAFREHDRRTTLPLELPPRGSIFVLFRHPCTMERSEGRNAPALVRIQEIKGPWSISFDPKWGGPASVEFDRLVDWTSRSEDGIKYYSGTAVYRKRVDLEDVNLPLWLDLGAVRELAEVRLGGKSLGVVWTEPFRVKISGAARKGENELEVRVTNLWPNRLIGDARLPRERRFTRTNVAKFDHPPKQGGAHRLLPSGLLGPVWLLKERDAGPGAER
ncbi:MAG: glycosylhydrolase-like jelly roll fold domain-containing protein, partial [Isosphaeraceae bacterium]